MVERLAGPENWQKPNGPAAGLLSEMPDGGEAFEARSLSRPSRDAMDQREVYNKLKLSIKMLES